MQTYDELDINYFNPQVDDWKPEDAAIEADHLADDAVVLFPITAETHGTGSLAETGFSALQALKLNSHRDFVVMIEQRLDDSLDNPIARRESLRARALVAKHLEKLDMANVYLVDSLEDMLSLSLKLYQIAQIREDVERYRSRQEAPPLSNRHATTQKIVAIVIYGRMYYRLVTNVSALPALPARPVRPIRCT